MKPYYNVIIFDCDGVLFDSTALKTEAFQMVLAEYPVAAVEEFIKYHKSHGGISRYVKFQRFFTDILAIEHSDTQMQVLLQKFSNACKHLYQTASFTPGCEQVLKRLVRHCRLFVASGSDETELLAVFHQRRINGYFEAIFGSPKSKEESVMSILQRVGPEFKTVMIGDSESDWKAATATGIDFIFMSHFSESGAHMQKLAYQRGFQVINNLNELMRLL